MKKIGLVGGISWVSTMDYYKLINEGINAKLGRLNFAECILYSLNFEEVQLRGWENAYELLLHACEKLKQSGADAIVLCANTAHLFAPQLEAAIQLPFINIITETGKAIQQQGLNKAGLLGTKFTMEMDFYRSTLEAQGITVLTPLRQENRDYIQHTLKEELGKGLVNPATKARYMAIANELVQQGAQCIILGCTEIPLLISQSDFSIPVFDSTRIHSKAIVEFALS